MINYSVTLETGQFHGHTNSIIPFNGMTLTDTEYTNDKVAWRRHKTHIMPLL